MPSKYDPEIRAKAVRLVLEHRGDYPSEWAAIKAVSSRLEMNAETLRNWIRQRQVDDGQCAGVSSETAAGIHALPTGSHWRMIRCSWRRSSMRLACTTIHQRKPWCVRGREIRNGSHGPIATGANDDARHARATQL
jgi:transposase